jgi:ABC-type Zn uptake system ZnuABC Zn-binding protein ZnuA
MKSRVPGWLVVGLIIALVLGGCAKPSQQVADDNDHANVAELAERMPTLTSVSLATGEKLKVVATTTIVADVVQAVGGDKISLSTLLAPNADPHSFEPTPRDAAAIAGAHVLFVHGLGLEEFLSALLSNVGDQVTLVPLSAGMTPLSGDHDEHDDKEGREDEHEGSFDPHTWFAVDNVMLWADNVATALAALDRANAESYRSNAAAYRAELEALDAWIREQVAQIPEARRQLVTDHLAFGYFADAYGLEQVGAVFPGYSSLTQPSAQELARLEDAIREKGVPAVFVGRSVNPSLAGRVATDTGVQLVYLYTGALSEAGGPADSYLKLMRYNVTAIVGALR